MMPLTLSHFWQRRIYAVVLFFSLILIALYAVPLVTSFRVTDAYTVDQFAAISAAAAAVLSIIFIFVKTKQPSFLPSYSVYLLFLITTTIVIGTTGGVSSVYVALWTVLAIASGIYGVWGVLPVLVITGVYVAAAYLAGDLNLMSGLYIALVSLTPSLLGLFLWRNESVVDESSIHVKSLTSQLSEVANRSEIIINAIGDGVVAVDATGTIQLINPAGQEILGWGKQDVLKLNYRSVLHLLDANNHELDIKNDPIAEVLNSNQTVRSNTLTIQTKSGKSIMSAMVVSPIGENGNGVIAVFRDITKEKAEEREQAEFISTASHEMRTPVASIEGYLGLALNPATATIDAKARDFILKAHESAEHLGRLFQDLLDVSKSEDGRMTSTPKVTDITELTGNVVEGLQRKAQEKGLSLKFSPTAQRSHKTFTPLYFVNQDPDHLREILDNLVENAIKYTPQGEVLVDIISDTEEKVIISVKDSGLGIPPEDLPHLFQKFYRVNNIDRQSIGGTGLGLYLSRRLAEAMQGRLWVESVYQKGSTFFLELPRVANEDAQRLKDQQLSAPVAIPIPTVMPVMPSAPAPQQVQQVAPQAVVTPQAMGAPQMAPQPQITQPAPQTPVAGPPQDTPSTPNVPRGQNLTREQIAERVRQLEALARATRPNERSNEQSDTHQP
jgi:PAS domain S-box-containing protein